MSLLKWKRVISSLLIVVLMLSPGMSVFAAASGEDHSPAFHDELLQFLTQEYGAEQASVLLQAIVDLGLADGLGQLRTHPIMLNGQSYTLDKVEALLANPEVDLLQRVQIDDMEISLGDLQRILEVESYIAAQLGSYNPADVQLTSEHVDSLLSLVEQAEEAGIPFINEGDHSNQVMLFADSASTGDYRDEVIVTLKEIRTHSIGRYKYHFELNQVLDVDVSFTVDFVQRLGTSETSFIDNLNDFDGRRGTFMIPAGETSGYITVVDGYNYIPGMDKSWQRPFNDIDAYMCGSWLGMYDLCAGDREELDTFRNVYQADIGSSQENHHYFHFHSFKNFDRMIIPDHFDQSSVKTTAFKHEYNGGAYGVFKGHREHIIASFPKYPNQYPLYYIRAYQHGVLSKYDLGAEDNSILSAQAYFPGVYTTDQLFPFWIMYENPGLTNHLGIGVNPAETINSVSFNNGMTGVPLAIDKPRLNYKDWGYSAFRYDYGAIVTKEAVSAYLTEDAAGQPPQSMYIQEVKDLYTPTAWIQTANNNILPDSPLLGLKYDAMPWNQEFSNAANIQFELAYARSDAFREIVTDQTVYWVGDRITVRIPLVTENGEADWIIDGAEGQADLAKRVQASIGDRITGRIADLDWARGENGEPILPLALEGSVTATQELLEQLEDADATSEGKQLRAKVYYNRNTDSGALELGNEQDFGMLANTFAYFTVAKPRYIAENELAIEYPQHWPSGEEYVVSLLDPAATVLSYHYPSDATYASADQFEWASSDESVATIQQDGTIIPVGSGQVIFTLTAKNNGVSPVSVQSAVITIDMSGAASLIIPSFANQVLAYMGSNAHVIWQTNAMERAREIADEQGTSVKDSHFQVQLYAGELEESELAAATPIHSWSSPQTDSLTNATSFDIPAPVITQVSTGYKPSYTVRVSVENPDRPGVMLTALSYIIVKSLPVYLELEKPSSQYVTDQYGDYEIRWSMEHFDTHNAGEFEFKITKNGALLPESVIRYDEVDNSFKQAGGTASQATSNGGAYRLIIDEIEDRSRLRDEYLVTIAAKNELDDTWSYDSLYIIAYNHRSFHIMVDGQPVGNHLTLDNNPMIREMDSGQIVGLKRNILLQHDMSINYSDFNNLNPIADQFAWKSDNNEVAVINFKNYGFFGNVEQLGYGSYQPKHHFALAGVGDGTTTIRAIHAQTGMTETLNLEINTLNDKLYLFQFYPKTETTVQYTNGDQQQVTVKSDMNGELAVYEEAGIQSDVYVTSEFNGSTYTGVIDKKQLLSKEPNPAKMSLYPINILQLRQLAQVEAYLKKPDGQPYTGRITYRAGVYKNGDYAERTEIGGPGVTEQLGTDGRLEIIFNTTDFYSIAAGEENASTLSAKDHIEFIIEVRFEDDRYYPVLLMYDGDLSPADRVALGEKNVIMKENGSGVPNTFMQAQYVQGVQEQTKTQLLDYNGKFGPNQQHKQVKLTADFLWWGEEDLASAFAELYTHTGVMPQGQSYQTFQYPFSDLYVTRHQQIINEDTIWLKKTESGTLEYRIYDENGLRKSYVPSAKLINMIGVQEISESTLRSQLNQLRSDMLGQKGSLSRPSNNDRLLSETFELVGEIGLDMGPIKMQIYPTDDPAVYRTIMTVEVGSLANTHGSGAEISFFNKQNFDHNIAPGAGDLFGMAVGTYLKEKKKGYETLNKSSYGGGAPAFGVSGYYLGEMRYNAEYNYWESVVLSGGFKAGGGFEYTHNWSMFAGPVPVTFSLTLGAQAEVGFNASILYDEVPGYGWKEPELQSVNDYVTTFRIIAYMEAFGGIGFDYTIIAAKIGVFGRLSVDNTNMWLNRDYLANSSDQVLYGNKLTLEGIVGIRVVLKFLFISFKHDFATFRYTHTWLFNNWKKIEDYWNSHAYMPLTSANLDVAIASYIEHEGIDDTIVFDSITMEDRDYLDAHERVWSAASPSALRAMVTIAGAADKLIESNAYPYSNPDVAADGSMFVFLSDNNSMDIADTTVHWAERTTAGYEDRGHIVNDPLLNGFGDSNVQIAGQENWIAAVWVRQMGQLPVQAGAELSSEEMMMMMNSAEIMASIYNGVEWKTTRLTDNKTPDLAPVVAVADGKVFVAYRSVYSDNLGNPLDFSQHDSIKYNVYDPGNGGWSDQQTLYNGTSGTIMGMSAAALADGTAAVTYIVDRDHPSQAIAATDEIRGQDQEVVYAVVDTSADAAAPAENWKAKGAIKNVQLTSDDYTNENPQVAAVRFADGEERFLIAWHSAKKDESGLSSDIRFATVNRQGEPGGMMVDSLSTLIHFNDLRVDPDFRFVKLRSNYNDIDHFSLIWRTTEYEQMDTTIVSRDRLKSVKFADDNGTVYLSGVLDVGAMPDYTQADTISAYANDPQGLSIRAILLGTTYTTDATEVGKVNIHPESEAGEEVPVVVANTISNMYELEETYRDQFNADEIILNPDEIVAGFDLPIIFNIINQGISPIDEVEIIVGGDTQHFAIENGMPNTNAMLTFYYNVPAQVKDETYTINVAFSNGATLTTNGTLYLNIPDVGIAKTGIQMEEASGLRELYIPLYNRNDTRLEGSGRSVKLALYSSNEYVEDNRVGSVLEIADPLSLSMLDAGAYLAHMTFDVQDYLTTLGEAEIPDKGIPLFARVWVEEADGSEVVEFFDFNNTADITVVHLSHKYNVQDVLVTHELDNTSGRSRVSLNMQNMNMAPIANGNVWVQLLDEAGQVLESRYVATNAAGLLSFSAEEKQQAEIEFDQAGHRIRTMFFVESADAMDATLSAAAFSGIEMNLDPGRTNYGLRTSDLKRTQFVATASNSSAAVTLSDDNGKVLASGSGFVALDLELGPNRSTFAVRVDAESAAGGSTEYRFEIQNEQTAKPRVEIMLGGNKLPNGEYKGPVALSLSAFDVAGYEIERAYYSVNGEAWKDTAYNGKSAAALTTVTEEGQYTVSVKLQLKSSGEYTLNSVSFKVNKSNETPKNPENSAPPDGMPKPEDDPTDEPAEEMPDDSGEEATDTSLFKLDIISVESLISAINDKLKATADSDWKAVFTDIQGHWAQDMIILLTRLEAIKGFQDGSFMPNQSITRAEFAAMLVRLFLLEDTGAQSLEFDDLKQHWAQDAIILLARHGIVYGYADGSFRPNAPITREEMVVMLMRLMNIEKLPEQRDIPFVDLNQAGHFAQLDIVAASKAGIINGYEDHTFRPKGFATRAETTTLLINLLKLEPRLRGILNS